MPFGFSLFLWRKYRGIYMMDTKNISARLDSIAHAREKYEQNLSRPGAIPKKIIGYFCTYTPRELIHAAGFLPVRVPGGHVRAERADSLVPSFICPYMRAATERALRGDFRAISGIVTSYTCDVACGVTNVWGENIAGEIFKNIPLPYNDSSDSRTFLRSELLDTAEKLNGLGGAFSLESLASSLDLYDRIRELILNLYTLLFEMRLPFSADTLASILGASEIVEPEEFLALTHDFIDEVKGAPPDAYEGIPVIVSGSLVEEPRAFIIIEQSGGRIVGDDLCTGFRPHVPARGKGKDPMDALIDRLLRRFPCPSRSRAVGRLPFLFDLIGHTNARGVIFLFQKFCTPHLADYPIIVEELKKHDIPSMLFEIEETGFAEGQLRTRCEGFFEMLGGS